MRMTEIEMITLPDIMFPIENVKQFISSSKVIGQIEKFELYSLQNKNQIILTLADHDQEPAAYVSFIERDNQVWQEAGIKSYDPYKGQNLVGKLYSYIKKNLHKRIQSDFQHTAAARYLWTTTLPKMGLNPMIYNSKTGYIIDPNNKSHNIDVYPDPKTHNKGDLWRYMWILETADWYRETDILSKDNILLPLYGVWYNNGITENERNSLLKLTEKH